MKRPLLALLLLLLCALARAGDDRAQVYGLEPPSPTYTLNRHLKLIEHALLGVVMQYDMDLISEKGDGHDRQPIPGFKAEGRSGYFADRKGTSEAIWPIWRDAQWAYNDASVLNDNMTQPQRDAARKAFKADPAKGTAAAAAMRAKLKPIAQFYLDATKDGKGSPTSITAFEDDLLVQYFRHAGRPEWNAFVPHLTGTVVPTSPEERYNLIASVSDARAFLRGILSRYVANPPKPGLVDVNSEYAEVDGGAQMIVAGDAAKLKPYYDAAGMVRPVKPAPAKPFITQFTAQENAVIGGLIAGEGSPQQKEWEKDQQAADADAAAMPRLVAKWKKKSRDAAGHVHAMDGDFKEKPGRENFEDIYLRQRLDKLDTNLWHFKQDLEMQAFHASRKSGPPDFGDDDTTAPERLAEKFRSISYADISDFAANGDKAKGEKLAAWIKKWLVPGVKFTDLAGKNPHPKAPPVEGKPEDVPADSDAALDAALAGYSNIEKAIIKKIASAEDKRKIAAGTSTKDWHKEALAAARAAIAPGSELRTFLAGAGVSDKAFSDFVCQGYQPGVAPGGNQSLAQLQTAAGNGQIAAGGDADAAKSGSDFTTNPALSKFCQDAANAGKTEQQQTPVPTTGLHTGDVPAPDGSVGPGNRVDLAGGGKFTKSEGGDASSGGAKKKGGKDWSDKMLDATLYGSIGWLGGTLIGAALGLGPFFFLGAVLAGAAIGVSMALMKDSKPDKKKGG